MVKGKKSPAHKEIVEYDREKEKERQMQMKLLEELEQSSSSTTSSESIDPYLSTLDVCEEEEELTDMIDTLYDTDNESLQDEEPEYVQLKPLEKKVDFFEIVGIIPDVEDISEDISMLSIRYENRASIKPDESTKDMGKFVDPLTGLDMPNQESTENVPENIDEKPVAVDEESDEGTDESEFEESEFYLPDDDIFDEDEDIKKATDAEDMLETFLELETKKVEFVEDDIDWEAIAKQQEAERIRNNTLDFISELIKKVVDTVEYISPEDILRQNLDKHKLLKELVSKLPSYAVEKNICQFLNHKVVQYFKRKKSFRPIMQDNPKTIIQDKLKYKSAVQHLDYLLELESKVNISTRELIRELNNEYDQAKEEAETKVEDFARLMKTNLCNENRPKTNALVELMLSRMKKYRKEVNEVRFTMLIYQHSQASLTDALHKLEGLGNGLSMRDFGSLQAETTTLGKKIEERNSDLNKLRIRCRSDIHTMAHYKEKQQMLRKVISIQKSVLRTSLENKHRLRRRLHCLKLEHKSIRNEIKDLSFQGGLLDKPALMFDYDITVERVHAQHAINAELRVSLAAIQHKLDELIKQCPELNLK